MLFKIVICDCHFNCGRPLDFGFQAQGQYRRCLPRSVQLAGDLGLEVSMQLALVLLYPLDQVPHALFPETGCVLRSEVQMYCNQFEARVNIQESAQAT